MNNDAPRLSARDQRLEDYSRRLWHQVGRCGTRRKLGSPSLPTRLGAEVELAAWIVDAVSGDNPSTPMPAREALSPCWRETLAAYPDVEVALTRGAASVVRLVTLGREERRVLAACAHGLSDRQIADVLGKPEGTVKATLSHVRAKFRALGREQLAA